VLESARFVHESASRLQHLIENFLVYSQIELMASEKKFIEVLPSIEALEVSRLIPEVAQRIARKYRRPAISTCRSAVPSCAFRRRT
jgi:uncharacterized membrane protein